MSAIIVLVGIPCSGKTTFSSHFCKYFTNFTTRVVNYDEICQNFSSQERKSILSCVEDLLQVPNHNHVIIIDDNNYYKSMRREYFLLCRKYKVGFLQIYFHVNLDCALQRNSLRQTPLPDKVIKDMFYKLEVPVENRETMHIYGNQCSFESVAHFLNRAILNPPVLKTTISCVKETETSNSELHVIDLALRKIINEKIRENPGKSKMFNIIKKVLFKNIKCKHIVVNVDGDLEKCLYYYFSLY